MPAASTTACGAALPNALANASSEPAERTVTVQGAAMSDPQRPRQTIELVDGRWTLPVLALLADGGRRYQDLDDALDGVSHKVLTATLRRAERDGLITRHVDPGRVDTATLYQLTDLGRSLDQPLAALSRWAENNWPQVEAARRAWNRRNK